MKKNLLNLALALAALAIFTDRSVAQGVQQKGKQPSLPTAGEKTLDPVLQAAPLSVASQMYAKKALADAIASTIITRQGKEFPLVATNSRRGKESPLAAAMESDNALTGGASCEPGDTQAFTKNAALDLESPRRVPKSNIYPEDPRDRSKVVSLPNTDWVVQSYYRVVTSAGPPFEAGDSSYPAGYSFLRSGHYSSVKSNMHSFVGALNVTGQIKADLNAKLDTLISNISSYSDSVSVSHGTVEHTALVRGTGRTNTNAAHSWYHGYINGTMVCAPGYLRDQNALTKRLETWVNSVVAKLPSTVNKGYEGVFDVYKGGGQRVYKP